jgi:SH3 domain protein
MLYFKKNKQTQGIRRNSPQHFLVTILFIVTFSMVTTSYATPLYVTDSIKITLRKGPSIRNKILKMLPTGTKLEVITSNKDWLQVRTSQGQVGWVLKRYTMSSTPQRQKVEDLRERMQQLTSEKERNEALLERIKAQHAQLQNNFNSTRQDLRAIQQKYEQLKTNAKDTLSLRQNYNNTLHELEITQRQLESLKRESQELRSRTSLRWFLYGGGVVLTSLIFGLFLGKMQRKKSPRYYF